MHYFDDNGFVGLYLGGFFFGDQRVYRAAQHPLFVELVTNKNAQGEEVNVFLFRKLRDDDNTYAMGQKENPWGPQVLFFSFYQ